MTAAAVVAAATLLLGVSAEPELGRGIRQVKDGDFEGALVTLDSLARNLGARPRPSPDLVTAYVWLAAAYAGLHQDALATAKLEQALRLDERLTLSAEDFPAKLLRLFEAARQKLAEEKTLKKQADAQPGSQGLLLVGAGVVVAGGVALAIQPGERANTPPSARIAISPEGGAIGFVTQVTFTADASDTDGDALTYEWDFGDGTTASGSPTTHTYAVDFRVLERTFDVRLVVRDGLAQTSAMASVRVIFFPGAWSVATPTFDDVVQVDFGVGVEAPGGRAVVVTALTGSGATKRGEGTVTHPRRVLFQYSDCSGSRTFRFAGDVGSGVATLQGTYTCEGPGRSGACQSCAGQQQTLLLRR